MKKKKIILASVWDKYPEMFSPERLTVDDDSLVLQLLKFFSLGDHYYYVIDIHTGDLTHQHGDICAIHGLDRVPSHLREIIDLIHPDDIEFVLKAEDYCYGKVIEIGLQYVPKLKSAYCFRMRISDGSYHLFHHQAITIVPDESNRISRSLNIHTDISDITRVNNYVATVMGIDTRSDFYQMDLTSSILELHASLLSKRERALLPYIIKGCSNEEISKNFNIATMTVRKHRQHILCKLQVKNSAALIKRCLELGYI